MSTPNIPAGEARRCETCANWQNVVDYYALGPVGTCKATPMIWDASTWNDKGERVTAPGFEGVTAFASDGSDYMAYLNTKPAHSCSMWCAMATKAEGKL